MCLGASTWAGLGEVVFGADGSVTSVQYYDQVDYSALRASRNARRDGDREPLLIQGGILFRETAQLLRIDQSTRAVIATDRSRHRA